jgi:16S rRNA (guanine966-N2)-methyltransferase
MRIIAGKFGRRTLGGVGKLKLRPTSDQLRETLFDVLGPIVEGSLFVDVYAGTGAVGIEALSRGAREVIFIEEHPAAVTLLRKNLARIEVVRGVEILTGDALRGLETLASRHRMADVIFLDPPYKEIAEYERTLDFLDGARLLAPAGRIVVEHPCRQELPDRLERLERSRLLEQGDAALSFYRLALAA